MHISDVEVSIIREFMFAFPWIKAYKLQENKNMGELRRCFDKVSIFIFEAFTKDTICLVKQ